MRCRFEQFIAADIGEMRELTGSDFETDSVSDELWSRFGLSFDEACILASLTPDTTAAIELFTPPPMPRRRKAS